MSQITTIIEFLTKIFDNNEFSDLNLLNLNAMIDEFKGEEKESISILVTTTIDFVIFYENYIEKINYMFSELLQNVQDKEKIQEVYEFIDLFIDGTYVGTNNENGLPVQIKEKNSMKDVIELLTKNIAECRFSYEQYNQFKSLLDAFDFEINCAFTVFSSHVLTRITSYLKKIVKIKLKVSNLLLENIEIQKIIEDLEYDPQTLLTEEIEETTIRKTETPEEIKEVIETKIISLEEAIETNIPEAQQLAIEEAEATLIVHELEKNESSKKPGIADEIIEERKNNSSNDFISTLYEGMGLNTIELDMLAQRYSRNSYTINQQDGTISYSNPTTNTSGGPSNYSNSGYSSRRFNPASDQADQCMVI